MMTRVFALARENKMEDWKELTKIKDAQFVCGIPKSWTSNGKSLAFV